MHIFGVLRSGGCLKILLGAFSIFFQLRKSNKYIHSMNEDDQPLFHLMIIMMIITEIVCEINHHI